MPRAEPEPRSPRPRVVGLDVLRVLAVVLVMGRHMWNPPPSWPSAVRGSFAFWHFGGWVGVDLFFVLSGFLVSGLLFAEFNTHGRISPLRFYARRAWKIYPPYFVMLATTVGVYLLHGKEFERIQLVAEVLFFQNYVRGLWNHTWSLAVEEHFYLLLPLVCLAATYATARRARSLRPILFVGAAVAVASLALRFAAASRAPTFSPYTHMFATQLRLDSLFFGVMLSYGYNMHRDAFVRLLQPWRWPLMAGGLVLLAPAFLLRLETSPFLFTAGYTVLYVGSGMLVVGALLCDGRNSRMLGGVAAVGASSYSIYLWHMPVLSFAIPWLEQMAGGPLPYGLGISVYLGGSIAVGMVMAKLVEGPALRLRDRQFPSRAAARFAGRAPRVIETPVGSAAIV